MNPERKILIADDDASIRLVLSQTFTRLGYQVRATGNAQNEKALEATKGRKPPTAATIQAPPVTGVTPPTRTESRDGRFNAQKGGTEPTGNATRNAVTRGVTRGCRRFRHDWECAPTLRRWPYAIRPDSRRAFIRSGTPWPLAPERSPA